MNFSGVHKQDEEDTESDNDDQHQEATMHSAYFNVIVYADNTDDGISRLKKVDSMTSIIGYSNGERWYMLSPVVDESKSVLRDAIYSASMKDCFTIEPSYPTRPQESFSIRLHEPATIELVNGDEYKLSKKGYIEVI